jgi:hypothetical protein
MENATTLTAASLPGDSRRARRWPRVLAGLLALLTMAAGGFVAWAGAAAAPMPEAVAALQSDSAVRVRTQPWLVFEPITPTVQTGLIFYPGARVDARAYAPAAHALAAAGYLVVIPPMPLNLALFGLDKAGEIEAAYPQIRHWALGGHSLGGAMAAQYAYNHPDRVQGLVLWAAYPAAGSSLADRPLVAAVVSGSQDGLATPAKVEAARSLLPATTRWVTVAGGNHAQFGWYGPQDGDGVATSTRADQQAQTVAVTVAVLRALAASP